MTRILRNWFRRTHQVRDEDPLGAEIRASLQAVQESVDAFGKWLDQHEATCPLCRAREAK